MSAPSTMAYGLVRISARSVNEPGSPSAPFTTTVAGTAADAKPATVRHFPPVGNPGTAPTSEA